MNRLWACLAVLPFLAAPVPPAFAASLTLHAGIGPKLYIADDRGHSVYMFEGDFQGRDTWPPVSRCTGGCAYVWPPLLVEGSLDAGEGTEPDLIGTLRRNDGTLQATYNGWPLYYYDLDYVPGDVEGHGVESFGNEWYLLGADGRKAGN